MHARNRHALPLVIVVSLGLGLISTAIIALPSQAAENGTKCEKVDNPTSENHTRCPGANLTTINFRGADLRWAELAGATLAGSDLSEANLSKADLTGANLTGAQLAGADLSEANLAGADLSGAVLASARLTEATLSGADLSESDLAPVLPEQTPLSKGGPVPVSWAEPPAVTGLSFRGCTPGSGSPFAVGTTTVTCSYQAAGDPATATARVTVHQPGSVNGTLPPARVNQPYSHQLTVQGFPDPYVFVDRNCTLPAGLRVERDGTVHGTPTEAGEFVVSLIPANASGGPWSAEARLTEFPLTVEAAATVVDPNATATPSAPAPAAHGTTLSDTGTHSAAIGGIGAAMIAFGLAAMVAGQRRRPVR